MIRSTFSPPTRCAIYAAWRLETMRLLHPPPCGEGRRRPKAVSGVSPAFSSLQSRSNTPSIFSSTSLFHTRTILNPSAARVASRVASLRSWWIVECWLPVTSTDDPRMVAGEVDDKVLDGHLPPKVKSKLLQFAQMQPELDLLAGHCAPKFARGLGAERTPTSPTRGRYAAAASRGGIPRRGTAI